MGKAVGSVRAYSNYAWFDHWENYMSRQNEDYHDKEPAWREISAIRWIIQAMKLSPSVQGQRRTTHVLHAQEHLLKITGKENQEWNRIIGQKNTVSLLYLSIWLYMMVLWTPGFPMVRMRRIRRGANSQSGLHCSLMAPRSPVQSSWNLKVLLASA